MTLQNPMFILARKLDRIALLLAWLAILAFTGLGTASMVPSLRHISWLSQSLYYVPAGLILLSMPVSFASGWLLHRLRLAPARIYLSIAIVASLLFLTGPYFGWAAWLGIPWVLKWHIQGFEKFMAEQQQNHTPSEPAPPVLNPPADQASTR